MRTDHPRKPPRAGWLLPAAFCLLATACDDGDAPTATERSDAGPAAEAGPSVPAPDALPPDRDAAVDAPAEVLPPAPNPLYAIASEVYAQDFLSSISYVAVIPSLDVKAIDFSGAREYSGRATIASINGWLFVSDAQAPVITRFSVAEDGKLTEAGRLSFANFGAETITVDDWSNTFISPTKAYFFNPAQGSHIVWNPTAMEIVGEIKNPSLVRPNLDLQSSPGIVRGNRLYRTYSWADWDAHTFSTQDQLLAIYDVETDKLVEMVVENRCPALYSRPFMDERGDVYFTNHIWNVTETLIRKGPKSCALRIKAGAERFDPAYELSYAALTGGHEGAVLTYLGQGQALLDVFHHERQAFDAMTDPLVYARTQNWHLWNVDLDKGTAAPLAGIAWKAGGYTQVRIQDVSVDRSFLMIPGKDYATTTAFEVKAGAAAPVFEVRGSSYLVLKVR